MALLLLVPPATAMLSRKGVCPEVLKMLKSFPSVTRRGKMSVFLGQLPAAANMKIVFGGPSVWTQVWTGLQSPHKFR